jgi:hypothetical protein
VVVEGKTTQCNVSVECAAVSALQGTLFLNGVAPAGWTAALKRDGAQLVSSALTECVIDVGGRFNLYHPGSGPFCLELHGSTAEGGRLVVRDRVTLSPGRAFVWDLNLPTGHLTVMGVPADGEKITLSGFTVPQFAYRWRGAGDLRVLAELGAGGSGGHPSALVPAGPGEVVRIVPAPAASAGYEEKVLERVEVPAGKTMQVRISMED